MAGSESRMAAVMSPVSLRASLRLPRANAAAETRPVVTSRDGGRPGGGPSTIDVWPRGSTRLATASSANGLVSWSFGFASKCQSEASSFDKSTRHSCLDPSACEFPAAWAPRIEAREDPAGAHQIGIHVRVVLPALGPVLTYEGIIDFEEQRE